MDVDLSGSVDITGVAVLLLFRHPSLHAMLTPAVCLPTSEFSRNLHDRLVSHMRGMFDILDRNHDGRRCCVFFCVCHGQSGHAPSQSFSLCPGRISFDELLREMYPYAKDKDIAMMVEWVQHTHT